MQHDSIPLQAIAAIHMQMVAIPEGEITLRDDRIKHTWTVEIKSFWLARYPVTQELYFAITHESPSSFEGGKKPVETVSWKEAIRFCNLLSVQTGLQPCYAENEASGEVRLLTQANGYRLPTEAEWEYACKAGTTESRYGALDQIAWYKANSQGMTHEVGLKAPNAWGLYDMIGNVWEWCSDLYDQTVYGSYRILRGGGWADEPRSCLATNRRRSHPTAFRIDDLGFRIARNMQNRS
jgi:formylglycine-generating enzyme required for sulfatase activity